MRNFPKVIWLDVLHNPAIQCPGDNFNWPFQGGASFVDQFCYLCFVFVLFSCLFIAALWLPPGKGLTSWLSCMWCFIVFWSLSHVVFRSGAWLYRVLFFAVFLTLIWDNLNLNLITWTTLCMLGFCLLFIVCKLFSYLVYYKKYHHSFKQFGSRSNPTFWSGAWSGSELFVKMNKKRQCCH